MIEQRELEILSPFAAKAAESAGRQRPEDADPIRTCYQRDRDRVLHSKSFRRLKHKTQVFISPLGDHFRTRLTHSLEVAQIARTIGRALRLNEDLIEAIALAHDVGHTPFGHAGEEALDEALRVVEPGSTFRHYDQSLHLVDNREPLNLTQEVRDGISGHSKGRKDLTAHDGVVTSTLEAAVVRVSDRIAYLNHDLDDAYRSQLISAVPPEIAEIGPSHGKRVSRMVEDVIMNSLDQPAIKISEDMLGKLNFMKEWLFANVYLRYPEVYPDQVKAKRIVSELFVHFLQPDNARAGYEGVQGAIDYVAGMTDHFAIKTFVELRVPSEFPEGA